MLLAIGIAGTTMPAAEAVSTPPVRSTAPATVTVDQPVPQPFNNPAPRPAAGSFTAAVFLSLIIGALAIWYAAGLNFGKGLILRTTRRAGATHARRH
ncbi:MAG TPA: hypothetical protein VGH54_21520 [Mycobacterium sp.]|jgi:hypothetical protein|uniref:hypothetical protein n=1 Tax=Mycobacterium sp. TaxID=1785 RepID=UPI002F40F0C3